MALATDITAGVEVSGSQEEGSYSYTTGSESNLKLITVEYTDKRTTTAFYAVTLNAIKSYMSAHKSANVTYDLVNRSIQDYTMNLEEVEREITRITVEPAPSGGAEA